MNDSRIENGEGTEETPAPAEQRPEDTSPAADDPAGQTAESPGPAETPDGGTAAATPAAAEPPAGEDPPPPAPPPVPPRRGGRTLAVLALVFALAAGGAAGYLAWLQMDQQEAIASQRADIAGRVADMRDLVADTEQRLAVQEERLGRLADQSESRGQAISDLRSGLRQARSRLEELSREEAGPERSPSLAEIEFLLRLARRELQLADNPRIALAALREADRRAARLDDPGLAEVRAAINDEIAAVEAVADTDLEGVALRLDSLAARVEGLPLKGALAPDLPGADGDGEGDAQSGWRRMLEKARGVTARLFRIRRTDEPATPLLAPDESFFLYRNVELDLKSARLAALARDPANYTAGLDAAERSLRQYFQEDDSEVASLLRAINDLKRREIAPSWPEISRSLELLRADGAED